MTNPHNINHQKERILSIIEHEGGGATAGKIRGHFAEFNKAGGSAKLTGILAGLVAQGVLSVRNEPSRNGKDAGLVYDPKTNGGDFKVCVETILDHKAFEHKVRYILKCGPQFENKAILFKPKTGINKICSIGPWFIKPDGSPANKKKEWKRIVDSWYPDAAKQRDFDALVEAFAEFKIVGRYSVSIQTGKEITRYGDDFTI